MMWFIKALIFGPKKSNALPIIERSLMLTGKGMADSTEAMSVALESISSLWRQSLAVAELNNKLGQITDEWTVDDIKTQLDRACAEMRAESEKNQKALDGYVALLRANAKEIRDAASGLKLT